MKKLNEPIKKVALRNKQEWHDQMVKKAEKYNVSMNCSYLAVIEAGLNSPDFIKNLRKYHDTAYTK